MNQAQIAEISDRVFGSATALDEAEAVTVGLILSYVRSRPAVSKTDVVAMTAIAALSETDPDLARSLMTELIG